MRHQAMKRRLVKATVVASAIALAMTGCGVTGDTGSETADGPIESLQVLVPNSPGGGYDITARSAVRVIEGLGLANGTEVTNLAGAGGTIGLTRLVEAESGNGNFLSIMGLGMVGPTILNQTDARVTDGTPIARLLEEAEAIFVPADSPFETVGDFIATWKEDPEKLPIGGGGALGGPDSLLVMMLAEEVGIDASQVNFVPYAGGGEMLPGILSGELAVGVSGYGEYLEQVEAGDLRILAVSSEERVTIVDAPTLTEEGIDLVFANWRGILAPPNITEEETAKFIDVVTEMAESDEWAEVMEDNGWADAFLPGEDFGAFLAEQDTRIEEVLVTLGLV